MQLHIIYRALSELEGIPEPGPDEPRSERAEWVRDYIARLNKKDAAILEGIFYERVEIRTLAGRLQVAPSTVNRRREVLCKDMAVYLAKREAQMQAKGERQRRAL